MRGMREVNFHKHAACTESAEGFIRPIGPIMVLAMGITFFVIPAAHAQELAAWQAGRAPVMTRWAADVSATNALPEYPRPQLVRPDWMNLNGLWDYSITSDSADQPVSYAGKILVPFPVESALSGVMTHFDEHSKIWYHRTFTV
jgi:hypothetical protein